MPIIEHLEFSKCAMGFFEWMALETNTNFGASVYFSKIVALKYSIIN